MQRRQCALDVAWVPYQERIVLAAGLDGGRDVLADAAALRMYASAGPSGARRALASPLAMTCLP